MKTRDRIVSAFTELAEERGFYNATVDELANRYSISKRTIYRHFKSKDEMIEIVLQKFMSETEKEVNEALHGSENPVERITNFVKVVSVRLRLFNPGLLSDLQKYYPHIWELVEQFRAQKIKILIEVMVEGSRQGYFKEINATIVTAAVLATVRAVINPTFMLENNLSPEATFTSVMNTFLYGIVNDKG